MAPLVAGVIEGAVDVDDDVVVDEDREDADTIGTASVAVCERGP